jgi:hypothetical protein
MEMEWCSHMRQTIIDALKRSSAGTRPEILPTLVEEVERMAVERHLSVEEAVKFVVDSYNWGEDGVMSEVPTANKGDITVEVDTLGARVVDGDKIQVGVYFHAQRGNVLHSASVKVFVPASDSIAELKHSGVAAAQRFLVELTNDAKEQKIPG